MGYSGQSFTIPLGPGGLFTDETQGRIPYSSLIEAKNVIVANGIVEKAPGARKFNPVACPAGVTGLFDWHPNTIRQRLVMTCRDGKVYRFIDHGETREEITASGAAPTTLIQGITPAFVSGGVESAERNKKLFLFSGYNQVQVISGDASVRTNMSTPAADWSAAFPTFGLIHRNRLAAFGNLNDPHRLYLSAVSDHENFVTNSLTFPVAPGEGDGLVSAVVYLGRLFLFKKPFGVYYLDDADPDFANWGIRKLSDSFGIASPHSTVIVLNDLLVANSTGSVTSLAATERFGDVESGDLLNALRNEGYMRATTSPNGTANRYAVYYEDKKQVMFAYQSAGGIRNDRILVIDYNLQNTPRITWFTKDQPNVLAMKRDTLGVLRPIYGAEDGFVYEMDRETRETAGVAYEARFQTPHIDFGSADPGLAERMKLFDFLELTFEELGNWNVDIDVFIDNQFSETISFVQTKDEYLDNFDLDEDEVIPRFPQSFRKPLHGSGRRISFRGRNAGLKQSFRIPALTVYFRVADDRQRS